MNVAIFLLVENAFYEFLEEFELLNLSERWNLK